MAVWRKSWQRKNLPYHINHVSSLGSLFFTEQEVVDYTSAKSSDTKAFSEYFKGECLRRESIWLRHSLRQCFYLLPIQMRS